MARLPGIGLALPTVLTALALLALSGCGSGSSSSSSSPSSSSSGSQAQQRQEQSGGAAEGGSGREGNGAGSPKRIESFGKATAGAERTALLGAFHGYLRALATRNYAAACSHLATSIKRSIERQAPPPLRREGCAAFLPGEIASNAAKVSREQLAGKVTAARVKGKRGFVIFRAPGARAYEMPMVREGGGWTVGLVAAAILAR